MGTFLYSTNTVSIDDQLLHYLQVVTTTKLRRGEAFTITLTRREDPEPRLTIWMSPHIPLRFTYTSPQAAPLVTAYLTELAAQANAASGLMVDLDTWAPPTLVQRQQAHHQLATRG